MFGGSPVLSDIFPEALDEIERIIHIRFCLEGILTVGVSDPLDMQKDKVTGHGVRGEKARRRHNAYYGANEGQSLHCDESLINHSPWYNRAI